MQNHQIKILSRQRHWKTRWIKSPARIRLQSLPEVSLRQTLGGYCCGYHLSATQYYGIPIGPGGAHEDNPKNKDPEAPRRFKTHGAKSFGTDSYPKNPRSVRQVIG